MEILIGAVILWIVPIFVARAVARPRHRAGFLYGFFLGWIGVIVVALLSPKPGMTFEELERKRGVLSPARYEKSRAELVAAHVYRSCPFCKEEMRRDASVCPHCRHPSHLPGRFTRGTGGGSSTALGTGWTS